MRQDFICGIRGDNMKTLKKELTGLLLLICTAIILYIMIDFIIFPECYVDGWKRDMKREIDAENQEVIDFYNEHYVANGRILFE